VEKYYVVAFAINFKQFYAYSKDCGAMVINWKICDDYPTNFIPDTNKNLIIPADDYNLNPVINFYLPTINFIF